ncbi:SGNH/GDSL hydrolase family protein [Fredinandcohnia humi]
MNRLKAIFVIAILLVPCFLLYMFTIIFNQNTQVSVETQPPIVEEYVADDSAQKEETEQSIDESTEVQSTTITEEIKEKVREVIEGTINLFKKDLKIVAIGDSLTQGVGDESEKGGYVGILNHTFEDNNVNIKIENYGKRGNRTDQLLKRLENKEISSSLKSADIILVTIGANDIMQVVKNNFTNLNMDPFQQENHNYKERLTAIFTRISELNPEAQIYLIGFYNPFEQYLADIEEFGIIINNWNHTGQTVTEEFENVHFIPVADLFSDSDTNLLANDYFHPNTVGYKQIARRVLDNMNEISIDTEIRPEDIEE